MSSTPWAELGCMGLRVLRSSAQIQCSCKDRHKLSTKGSPLTPPSSLFHSLRSLARLDLGLSQGIPMTKPDPSMALVSTCLGTGVHVGLVLGLSFR